MRLLTLLLILALLTSCATTTKVNLESKQPIETKKYFLSPQVYYQDGKLLDQADLYQKLSEIPEFRDDFKTMRWKGIAGNSLLLGGLGYALLSLFTGKSSSNFWAGFGVEITGSLVLINRRDQFKSVVDRYNLKNGNKVSYAPLFAIKPAIAHNSVTGVAGVTVDF